MNIRKNVDYSDMYAALERIMAADMAIQMRTRVYTHDQY